MEITLYNNIDPRRLLPSAYKSFADVVPILGGMGEPVVIDSQTKATFDGNVPVMRDLTLKGKYCTSFVIHGNSNLTLDHAEVENTPGAMATITLASDFSGTVTIIDSNVHYQSATGSMWAIGTEIEDSVSSNHAKKITISNSSIDGIAANPTRMDLSGNVTIASISKAAESILNVAYFNANEADLTVNNLRLFNPGNEPVKIRKVILIGGPVEFNGKWNIDTMVINSNSSSELYKFIGQQVETVIKIHKIDIERIPKGISVFYADNAILKFENSFLGTPKIKYQAAINKSIMQLKSTTDRFHWVLSGKNYIDIDQMSISELKNRQNEFTTVDFDTFQKQEEAQLNPASELSTNQNGIQNEDISNQNDDSLNNLNQSSNNNSNMKKTEITDAEKQMSNATKNSQHKIEKADGMSRLNSLIGLKPVKKAISDFISVAITNKERAKRGLKTSKGITMHMVFGGDPGTGKTTVARICGQILCEQGVLENGKVHEVTTKDLISKNVGETTTLTHNKVMEAMGGILFVDEAYMLTAKGNSFATEAIDQLMKDMEDYRDNLIVILAGYNEEMHHFIYDTNPGLQSRINNWIDFPDYSLDELLQIFKLQCKDEGTLINNSFLKTKMFLYCLNNYQGNLHDKHGRRVRSNGRGVRNYYDALKKARDARLNHSGIGLANLTDEQLMTITAKDIKTVYAQIQHQHMENKKLAAEEKSNNNPNTQNKQ